MKATKVTAGLAQSNGSLLPGLWRDLLHVTCRLTACTPGSAPGPTLGNEYGKTLPFKGSPYSITERRVPELIPVLGSQPAGDVSHKPGGRLPLLSARSAVTPATLKRAVTNFCCLVNRGTMGVNSLPKTVTGQHRGCDLNPGPSAPESSTLATRLSSHLSSPSAEDKRYHSRYHSGLGFISITP